MSPLPLPGTATRHPKLSYPKQKDRAAFGPGLFLGFPCPRVTVSTCPLEGPSFAYFLNQAFSLSPPLRT